MRTLDESKPGEELDVVTVQLEVACIVPRGQASVGDDVTDAMREAVEATAIGVLAAAVVVHVATPPKPYEPPAELDAEEKEPVG